MLDEVGSGIWDIGLLSPATSSRISSMWRPGICKPGFSVLALALLLLPLAAGLPNPLNAKVNSGGISDFEMGYPIIKILIRFFIKVNMFFVQRS